MINCAKCDSLGTCNQCDAPFVTNNKVCVTCKHGTVYDEKTKTCIKPQIIIIPVPTTPIINAPFIPDVEFFIEDSVNSFTFLDFTLTGDDKDAFLMTLKSYLVDPQNPLLNKDLPSGVKFMPMTRKYRFRNQDVSSYELKIVCHLTLDEKYVAEK